MRTSGVLLHITSLPSPYGIGTMGRAAYEFADFLAKAGQSWWQILPLCPTSYGDSPYQSFSTFAGNPYLIDLETLIDDGLLTRGECEALPWGESDSRVDYAVMYDSRYIALQKAFDRFMKNPPEAFGSFCRAESVWLDNYALFMAIKQANDGVSWSRWDDSLRFRRSDAMANARKEYAREILFHKFTQYEFFIQWKALRKYVNSLGIGFIGDLPIYVSADSADVWADPRLFMMDDDLRPISVAGCPPDYFCADGQLWGNPLYNWDELKKDDYGWWARRLAHCRRLYDMTRIDHFRGFEAFYSIPYGMPNARVGEWRKGPGVEFFRTVERQIGRQSIIAEDLGFLTPDVVKMLRSSGYPGMKVLQFAFDPDGDSTYLPHNYPKRCVVYTGTHDNDTIIGWSENASRRELRFAKDYCRVCRSVPIGRAMMLTALSTVADTVILTMQDLLGLGSEARMNTPSTIGSNWQWRMKPGVCTEALAADLRGMCETYRRFPQKKKNAAANRRRTDFHND